jgi:hypothetical protein
MIVSPSKDDVRSGCAWAPRRRAFASGERIRRASMRSHA